MYSSAFLRVAAVVYTESGAIPLDVVSVSCKFERNSIPRATILVPVGREGWSGLPSNVYQITPNADQLWLVDVYLQSTFTGGLPFVPNGEFLLFRGYLTGLGFRRQDNSINAAIEITHWLTVLNFSSCLSATSVPENPAQLIFKPVQHPGGGAAITPIAKIRQFITVPVIESDFWTNGLRSWFLSLTEDDAFFSTQFGATITQNDTIGKTVAAALLSIKSVPGAELALDLDAGQAGVVVDGIVNDIVAATIGPNMDEIVLANMTIWDKLVNQIVPSYMFDIIPRPLDALVVPVVPGLRTPYQLIAARDQISVDLNAMTQIPLRAVGLVRSGPALLSGNVFVDFIPVPGEFYMPKADGVFIFRATPPWLDKLPIPSVFAAQATGNNGVKANNIFPKAGKEVKPSAADRDAITKTALNRMAHMYYCEEMLSGRHGNIATALRFDIAPGSTIQIEAPGGEAPAGWGITGPFCYATVRSVEYTIDVESKAAVTLFNVSHIRSQAENMDDRTSVARHPLYKNNWAGGPLIG